MFDKYLAHEKLFLPQDLRWEMGKYFLLGFVLLVAFVTEGFGVTSCTVKFSETGFPVISKCHCVGKNTNCAAGYTVPSKDIYYNHCAGVVVECNRNEGLCCKKK